VAAGYRPGLNVRQGLPGGDRPVPAAGLQTAACQAIITTAEKLSAAS